MSKTRKIVYQRIMLDKNYSYFNVQNLETGLSIGHIEPGISQWVFYPTVDENDGTYLFDYELASVARKLSFLNKVKK